MKIVLIVNGKPRSGKDSVVRAMTNLLMAEGVPVASFSSIDPIRSMLMKAGLDVRAKTPEDRDLMAEVGDSVEKHSNFRSNECVFRTVNFFESSSERAAMFIHAREKLIIDRISDRLESHPAGPYRTIKVLVTSPRSIDIQSNAADRDVGDVGYDDTIVNDGTLDDLARRCDKLLFQYHLVEQLSLLR